MTIACPNCQTTDTLPIVYGFPGKEMIKASFEGKIVLGGCVLTDNSPQRHCNNCDHEWQNNPNSLWSQEETAFIEGPDDVAAVKLQEEVTARIAKGATS